MIEEMSKYWPEFLMLAGAHLLAVASPGIDFAVVTKHTIKYGKKTGIITALGVGTAILLHVTYALLGFSIIIKTNEILYLIIKWLGAIFLIYLGFQSLQAKSDEEKTEISKSAAFISDQRAYAIGFLTNALNIKAILFFLFLFTSLVSEITPTNVQIFYGIWMSVVTALWFIFVASVFGQQQVQQFFMRFGIWFDRMMGILLIVLAVLLLTK